MTEPAGYGGTAYYAHELVRSLKGTGVDVILDTSPFHLSPVFSHYSATQNKIACAYYYTAALVKIWRYTFPVFRSNPAL